MQYLVIKNESLLEFTAVVNDALKEGYRLHGELQTLVFGGVLYYMREMVKE